MPIFVILFISIGLPFFICCKTAYKLGLMTFTKKSFVEWVAKYAPTRAKMGRLSVTIRGYHLDLRNSKWVPGDRH